MEIYQANTMSKDELITFLDELQSDLKLAATRLLNLQDLFDKSRVIFAWDLSALTGIPPQVRSRERRGGSWSQALRSSRECGVNRGESLGSRSTLGPKLLA